MWRCACIAVSPPRTGAEVMKLKTKTKPLPKKRSECFELGYESGAMKKNLLLLAALALSPLVTEGWTVYHEEFDGKTRYCEGQKHGQPYSYTALVYKDEFKEIVCEPKEGSGYTVRRMKAIAQLFNDLDKNRPVLRYDPDQHWIKE